MKKRRLKRKVVVVIIALIVVILGFIGYLLLTDLKQEDILRKEITSLSSKDLTKGSFDITIKTKGDYAKVEMAIKSYLDEYAETLQSISKISDSEILINMLTATNYKEDGPDFVKSKEFLEKSKKQLSDGVKKLDEMSTPSEIKKNIEEKKLNKYYNDLYNELMNKVTEGKFSELDGTIKVINETISARLNDEEAVIDLLIANKGKWSIKDDKIIFSETATINKYNELTKKLAS